MSQRPIPVKPEWDLPDAIIHLLGKSTLNEYYSLTALDSSRYGVFMDGSSIRERYDLRDGLDITLNRSITSHIGPRYVEFLEEKGREIWKRLYRKASISLFFITAMHGDDRIEISKDISEVVVSLNIWKNLIITPDTIYRDVIIFPEKPQLNDAITDGMKHLNRRGRPPTHDWDAAIDEFLCLHIREAEFENVKMLTDAFASCFHDPNKTPEECTIRKEFKRRFPKFYVRAKGG